jgi:hypothetical protein
LARAAENKAKNAMLTWFRLVLLDKLRKSKVANAMKKLLFIYKNGTKDGLDKWADATALKT